LERCSWLEDVILLRCPYHPKWSTDSYSFYQSTDDVLYKNRKEAKICMET
jgi:hypothetical protein